MENLERQASILFGEKEYEKALEIYLLLYKGSPKTESYIVSCGNCYDAMGEKEKAIQFYNDALKVNKNSEAALLNLSTINYELKNFDASEAFAQRVLALNPNNIAALQNVGNVAFCQANYEIALSFYQKMYEYNNNSYIAMINIANTYYCMEKYVLSLEFAKKSLAKHPSSITAHMIAGNALNAMGKYEKAIQIYSHAYELNPSRAEILSALSEAYRSVNDWEKSVLFAWRFMKICTKDLDSAHLNFGYLLYECYSEKNPELAEKYAAKWLKHFPDNKIVHHMANAIVRQENLQNSDADFIKATFDSFAPDFDATLADLDYQAPELIYEAVAKHLKSSLFSKYYIADLGCGTGLCGEKLKKFASRKGLIGIDLSAKMLEMAEQKKIYTQLFCDDICHYLENSNYLFHLITASDVWTYFGDLAKPFVRVSRALMPEGLFVFTVSENSFNEDDFFLTPSGRFVHNITYVERVLKSTGLRMLSAQKKILRNEGERPVYGYVIVAQKPNLNAGNEKK